MAPVPVIITGIILIMEIIPITVSNSSSVHTAGRDLRNNFNSNDRLIKQNDIIIRLLKEIRDRLPPPPIEESDYDEHLDQGQLINDIQNDNHEEMDAADLDDDAVVMEPAEDFSDEQDSYSEDEDNH